MRRLQPERVELNWSTGDSVLTSIEFDDSPLVLVWFDDGHGERSSRFDLGSCFFLDPLPKEWTDNTAGLARLLLQVVITHR